MTVFETYDEILKAQLDGFIDTPPLWKGSLLKDFKQFEIPQKDFETSIKIPEFPPKLYLGKRAEIYLQALLHASKRFTVLTSNLQIQDNGRTIGELDLIILDTFTNEVIHVEQVYKFYVYDTSVTDELSRWIGPNKKDRLVDKLQKLKTHQLPLLHHPKTFEALQKLQIKTPIKTQQLCFKAHCFLPLNYVAGNLHQINADCVSGYYIPYSDFITSEYKNYKYLFPKKVNWPVNPRHGKEWLDFETAKAKLDAFIEDQRSPLVWLKDDHTYKRIFVVWW